MKLPNSARAFVDETKLREYCLNPDHPRGRHKARVFASALGLSAVHAALLHAALVEAVTSHDATPTLSDDFGDRFVVDFVLTGTIGSALVRSAWIVRHGEDFARLTSCYVL